MTDENPNRSKMELKIELAGIKVESCTDIRHRQAQAQRRGGADQEKNDNQNTTLRLVGVRKGVVRGAQQVFEIMCGRFVSVRLFNGSEMAYCIIVHILFWGG